MARARPRKTRDNAGQTLIRSVATPGPNSGIRDNVSRGKAGDFLRSHLGNETTLSVVSAYFTIHAYHALKEELDTISRLRFLFGDPQFINQLDKDAKESREFSLTEGQLKLTNQLSQGNLAKQCADWVKKVCGDSNR